MRKILKILTGLVIVSGLIVAVTKLADENPVGPQFTANIQLQFQPSIPPLLAIVPIPSDILYQGEALRVEVVSTSTDKVVFRGKEYKFFEYQGKLNVVIPLAVDEEIGEAEVNIGGETLPIRILAGIFKTEEIPPPKPLTPKQLAQREGETKSIAAAYKTIAPTVYFDSAFIPPLEKLFETSPFGVQRVIKTTGQRLSAHNGTDFRAAVGTPVKAVNDGVVELAESYLFEGGFVILNHGMGINSVYLHLSKVNVKNGEQVEKGQVIGLSGGSGQSVGPHLHFMIKINGIAVDPLRFLDLWK